MQLIKQIRPNACIVILLLFFGSHTDDRILQFKAREYESSLTKEPCRYQNYRSISEHIHWILCLYLNLLHVLLSENKETTLLVPLFELSPIKYTP